MAYRMSVLFLEVWGWKGESMDRIASIIKHQRELLGLSLEDLSVKTKLTLNQLEALEQGNINYFKDDISYLPFIIRFVATNLELDYANFKDDVDQIIASFHSTQAFKKIQQRDELHRSIKQKASKLGVKKKKNIDYTFISLMVLLSVLVFALIFTFFTVILPRLTQNNDDSNTIVELPENPDDDDTETPTDPIDEQVVLIITESTYNTYVIADYDETKSVNFKVIPQNRPSWIRFTLNNSILTLPATATYPINQEVIYEMIPTANDEVSIRLGDMIAGNILVLINDQPITLNSRFDTRISNNGSAGSLTFRFIGE